MRISIGKKKESNKKNEETDSTKEKVKRV